ncbi:MAG: polysaccharide deacetylase family protein [Gorillibacterium sp.]|nr:polysaccharide deacetylase family protein [Gorillibacterium sp.]
MNIRYNCFPGGRHKALTLSYDDGRIHDRRLIDILNTYGLKGSFHLNSGLFGRQDYIRADEVKTLYSGHEVSVHTVTHPFLNQIPKERLVMEIMEDRHTLEGLAGYPVRGMSYPFGSFNQEVVHTLPALGIQYARTTISTGGFGLPEAPLEWKPTCHHKDMLTLGETFINSPKVSWNHALALFYIWGHSYEFENDQNWADMEALGRMMAGHDEIWLATNIEIIDYLDAVKSLQFSVDGSLVRNPSSISVWIEADGTVVELKPGVTQSLI